jgi:hypothetical protein
LSDAKPPEVREYVDPQKLKLLESASKMMAPYIAKAIEPLTGSGFALFLFTADGPELVYISNAERADMARVLKQFLDNLVPEAPDPTKKYPGIIQ